MIIPCYPLPLLSGVTCTMVLKYRSGPTAAPCQHALTTARAAGWRGAHPASRLARQDTCMRRNFKNDSKSDASTAVLEDPGTVDPAAARAKGMRSAVLAPSPVCTCRTHACRGRACRCCVDQLNDTKPSTRGACRRRMGLHVAIVGTNQPILMLLASAEAFGPRTTCGTLERQLWVTP